MFHRHVTRSCSAFLARKSAHIFKLQEIYITESNEKNALDSLLSKTKSNP